QNFQRRSGRFRPPEAPEDATEEFFNGLAHFRPRHVFRRIVFSEPNRYGAEVFFRPIRPPEWYDQHATRRRSGRDRPMDDAPPLPFGDHLRRLREAAGLSQEALAERAGVSARGISDLERGLNHAPQRETVLRLAGALTLTGAARAVFEEAAQRRHADSRSGAAAPPGLPPALPVPLTALLGRDGELRALTALLP